MVGFLVNVWFWSVLGLTLNQRVRVRVSVAPKQGWLSEPSMMKLLRPENLLTFRVKNAGYFSQE